MEGRDLGRVTCWTLALEVGRPCARPRADTRDDLVLTSPKLLGSFPTASHACMRLGLEGGGHSNPLTPLSPPVLLLAIYTSASRLCTATAASTWHTHNRTQYTFEISKNHGGKHVWPAGCPKTEPWRQHTPSTLLKAPKIHGGEHHWTTGCPKTGPWRQHSFSTLSTLSWR